MTFWKKTVILLLSVLGAIAKPVESSERIMLRKRLDVGNAESYVYRSDNNGPMQIYYLTSDDLNRKFHHPPAPIYHQKSPAYKYTHTPIPSAYPITYYPPKAHVQSLGKLELQIPVKADQKPYPIIYYPPKTYTKPLGKLELPIPIKMDQKAYPIIYYPPKTHGQALNNIEMPIPIKAGPKTDGSDESNSHSSSSSDESNSNENDYGGDDGSRSDHSNENKNFALERGQSHEEKYHKKKGQNSNNGYNNEFKFKTGKKGSYSSKHDSADEEEKGGKKSSHYDDADNHSGHDAAGKHKEGGDYEAKKHHNKGSKSKGYHNVFMKDEYKKDHTFYGTETVR